MGLSVMCALKFFREEALVHTSYDLWSRAGVTTLCSWNYEEVLHVQLGKELPAAWERAFDRSSCRQKRNNMYISRLKVAK